jgi:hypothetical protein
VAESDDSEVLDIPHTFDAEKMLEIISYVVIIFVFAMFRKLNMAVQNSIEIAVYLKAILTGTQSEIIVRPIMWQMLCIK